MYDDTYQQIHEDYCHKQNEDDEDDQGCFWEDVEEVAFVVDGLNRINKRTDIVKLPNQHDGHFGYRHAEGVEGGLQRDAKQSALSSFKAFLASLVSPPPPRPRGV